MRLGLHVIAKIFNWTDDDIQINDLLFYCKNLREKNEDIANKSRLFLNKQPTAPTVMHHFVDLIENARPYMEYCTPYVIVNTKSGVTHESFEDMARYWSRIKKRLNDDNAFQIAFENNIYNYHISERKHPMSLKDFLKTDHIDLNKSPMFRQLIQNLKKKPRKDS